jgi:hypothetical protein
MFDKPPPAVRSLSRRYGGAPYRVSIVGGHPKWSAVRLVRAVPCDECFANQHETQGRSGVRGTAHHQRKLDTAVLRLCSAHALLWRERDEADQ